MTPWNVLLYSSRQFQDTFPFLGGRSFYIGQTRIFVQQNSRAVKERQKNVANFSLAWKFWSFLEQKSLFGQNENCRHRETGKSPGTASMNRANHSKTSNSAQLSVRACVVSLSADRKMMSNLKKALFRVFISACYKKRLL